MARKKTTADNSVVVLETSIGEPLIIRANPTDDEVRAFVEEHSKRFVNGAPGGPSGIPAYQIHNATRYDSQEAYLASKNGDGEVLGSVIDVTDLIP